jgi:CRISPR-associated protein Cas1
MALHALAYCPRLFYLEEVEEIRVADDRVFAGRELHASLEDAEEGEPKALELECPDLGLVGKVDCLRRLDGALVPYEHKRGRCRRGESNRPEAWESDRLQVAAYAMMLEEALDQPIPEGRVRYHQDNVTVRVPLDGAARQAVHDAVAQARRLRDSLDRPPVADNENLCVRCSLSPVCLPEETRRAARPDRPAVRLYPEARNRTTLHVMAPGAAVGRSGDMLVVRPRDGSPARYPAREVLAVVLHGFSHISTQALRLCTVHDIGVHWVTAGGKYVAGLAAGPGQVHRRLRQYAALSEEPVRLRLARALALAKIEGQVRFLLRATRGDDTARTAIEPSLRSMRQTLHVAARAKSRDELRGHEGESARAYFGCLNHLLGQGVPEELRFARRSRRPPQDRFNALLGFGYALLQTTVMRAVLAVGLEPALGFFHTPRSAAHPLVLDLMELWRVPLWDMVLVASLNRGQWKADEDFAVTPTKVWLSETGRRKAIQLFEGRLQESWKHPVLGYSLTYDRAVELEVRLLEKEWSGEPGLFARMRLR